MSTREVLLMSASTTREYTSCASQGLTPSGPYTLQSIEPHREDYPYMGLSSRNCIEPHEYKCKKSCLAFADG